MSIQGVTSFLPIAESPTSITSSKIGERAEKDFKTPEVAKNFFSRGSENVVNRDESLHKAETTECGDLDFDQLIPEDRESWLTSSLEQRGFEFKSSETLDRAPSASSSSSLALSSNMSFDECVAPYLDRLFGREIDEFFSFSPTPEPGESEFWNFEPLDLMSDHYQSFIAEEFAAPVFDGLLDTSKIGEEIQTPCENRQINSQRKEVRAGFHSFLSKNKEILRDLRQKKTEGQALTDNEKEKMNELEKRLKELKMELILRRRKDVEIVREILSDREDRKVSEEDQKRISESYHSILRILLNSNPVEESEKFEPSMFSNPLDLSSGGRLSCSGSSSSLISSSNDVSYKRKRTPDTTHFLMDERREKYKQSRRGKALELTLDSVDIEEKIALGQGLTPDEIKKKNRLDGIKEKNRIKMKNWNLKKKEVSGNAEKIQKKTSKKARSTSTRSTPSSSLNLNVVDPKREKQIQYKRDKRLKDALDKRMIEEKLALGQVLTPDEIEKKDRLDKIKEQAKERLERWRLKKMAATEVVETVRILEE